MRCGNSMLQRIKRRYDLFSGVGTIKKQIHLTDKTTECAQQFLVTVERAYVRYGAELLLTMNEVWWPLVAKQSSLIKIRNESVR
jgi:hypothetical protein